MNHETLNDELLNIHSDPKKQMIELYGQVNTFTKLQAKSPLLKIL